MNHHPFVAPAAGLRHALEQQALDAWARGAHDEAQQLWRVLLARDAGNVRAHNNLANLLRHAQRHAEAETHYRLALEREPGAASIHGNLGGLLERLHRYDEAEAGYRRALDLDPSLAEVRFNLGLLLLGAGRYAEGWLCYEARGEVFREHGELPFPEWRGEDLQGKRLLLLPEQGYGDVIQFVRYAPLLKARGASNLTLLCRPELAPLLRTVKGLDAVVTEPGALRPHDYWISLLSLPYRCGTTLDTIPADIPYLGVFAERLECWRGKLPSDGVRVGLVWKGSPAHANDAERSLPHFSGLLPLWSVGGVRFVSLQTDGAEAEIDACGTAAPPILRFGAAIRDFADTAAIVAQLNLVICVDTAVAHVAGALGVACWVMLPGVGSDWRWLRAGMRSPWYPRDLYLFRQPAGGWPRTIDAVRAALADVVPS